MGAAAPPRRDTSGDERGMTGLKDRLSQNEVIVFDGGVGTYLYEKGIYINTCFDELNLTNPGPCRRGPPGLRRSGGGCDRDEHVRRQQVQARAARAGEESVRDQPPGGADRQRRREETGLSSRVRSGPLGVQIEPLGKLSFDEATDAFREQIKGLLDGGVDLIILETFSWSPELLQAIKAVKELNASIPVIAQVTINDDGQSAQRRIAREFRQGGRCHAEVDVDRTELFRRAQGHARRPGDAEDTDGAPDLRSTQCGTPAEYRRTGTST